MTAGVNERPSPSVEGAPTGEGLTFEKVWATIQEVAERQKETDRLMKENAERQKETDRLFKETDLQFKEAAKQHKKTEQIVGNLGNRFGELVEHLVAPNIKAKFNERGFCFTKTGMNIEIADPKNPDVDAEVDILLENGDIVVAVEVKAKPNDDDVNDHIQRMEILRRYADEKQDKRRHQGAIAGAVMSKEIRRYILRKGFYAIEQTGDTVRINVPEGFKAREW
jgi:hypothetical protein